jgi:hypothetical protein
MSGGEILRCKGYHGNLFLPNTEKNISEFVIVDLGEEWEESSGYHRTERMKKGSEKSQAGRNIGASDCVSAIGASLGG